MPACAVSHLAAPQPRSPLAGFQHRHAHRSLGWRCADPHRMAWRPTAPVAAAASGQAAVAESLHLLRFAPGTPEEEVAQVVDGIWSLQYMAAGPICGSAGPLVLPRFGAGGSEQAAQQGGDASGGGSQFSHAVLFRYADEASLQRFEAQPRVQLMLGGSGAPPGTAITTLNFLGSVPNELEAVFRRGGDWAEGVELVLALGRQEGASEADATEFLTLTQQLALSSAFGAVQCSHGRCLSAAHAEAGPAAAAAADAARGAEGRGGRLPLPDALMLARFQERGQLRAFLDCPPVAALLEDDDRLPLRALWSCALETAPSDSSSSRGVGRGLL